MATITFGEDPVAESRALIEALRVYLSERPEQPAKNCTGKYDYTVDGALKVLVITVEPD